MNLLWGFVIVAVAVAVAVAAMLLVRRRAPDGSYFSDGDRASGVFGVLATGFSLLLGLIVFLAFTSYDESKTGPRAKRSPWSSSSRPPSSCRPPSASGSPGS
jgi:hypothetical protein